MESSKLYKFLVNNIKTVVKILILICMLITVFFLDYKKEKFKITCQTCGSNDVSILEDYDCDDHSYVYGYYLECNVCKENNL